MQNRFSYFQKLTDKKPTGVNSIYSLYESIRTGAGLIKSIVPLLRSTTDKKVRTALKKDLPAVTFSGIFNTRKKEGLKEYSQFICIDLDDVPNPTMWIDDFANDIYTHLCFISPSGTGIKIIYKVDCIANDHEKYFLGLAKYITNKYGLLVDSTGSDICRLCFLSYDENIYMNENSTVIDIDFIEKQSKTYKEIEVTPLGDLPPTLPPPKPVQKTGFDYFEKCNEIASKSVAPTEGTYNAWLNHFARHANRYGLSEIEVHSYVSSLFGDSDNWIKPVVKSVYTKFANEAGDWLKQDTSVKAFKSGENASKKTATAPEQWDDVDDIETLKFWYEVENEKTGKIEYKFGYDASINFLQANGFYRFPLDNDYYQFIHVNKQLKQVEVIQPIKIKDFMLAFLKKEHTPEYNAVREMFRRGAKNYCSVNQIEGLDYYKPVFKKDTAKSAFVYFRNCYLEITKDEIKTNQYTSLDNHIWSKQVIDFDYTPTAYDDSDFTRFVSLAIIGAKIPAPELDKIQLQKLESFATTVGYLLHRYKNPALTKAVVAVDKRLRTTGENNGRTGKSLLSKALAKMLNMCNIDGKNFKFDSPFPFQKANIDTELINFNDVLKNFDFERLFGMITEEFTFEKKGKDSITLAFDDAPKFYISTNTTLKGSGESNKGRQQIIEFDNYFNTEHTPVKEFGRMFFHDWDDMEYSKFYTYMIECIKYYLENGLIDFPLENYEINKLIDTAGEEFIDYMNEIVKDQLHIKTQFDNKELFDHYIAANKHRDKTQIKTFNKNIKTWAQINNLEINAHLNGERDKRNNITYLTFTAKIEKDELLD